MRYSEVLARLQNLTSLQITQAELCRVLNIKQSTMGNRQNRDSNFSDDEITTLEHHYNVKLQNNICYFPVGDRIEIGYWEQLPEDLKNPNIMSVWFDREIIENAWGMKADHLCIVPMIGDKMTKYWYPIRNNDILIIDTSHNYIMGNGVYFATSRNNTRFWIREMQVLINDDIQIKGFAPSGETTKVFKPEQFKEVDFKIIGKVIKNVSFRL